MTRLDALTSLRDQCKAGLHWNFSQLDPTQAELPDTWVDAFNGSLDAAKALHEAVLPGWYYTLSPDYAEVGETERVSDFRLDRICFGEGEDPARAWLLAILEALIAQEEAKA